MSVTSDNRSCPLSLASGSARSHPTRLTTYEMEADALTDVGHLGFTVDAQGMVPLLYDFATRADHRALARREFDGFNGTPR
jgi:hypothetical protein